MEFKQMYAKPIDRPIDPVVKAGSDEYLENELEEYIITPEIEGHLIRFFDEYNSRDATGNGAWISGFFGSGKSHMLKILAVVLEDREVNGKKAFDYLLPKVDSDPALRHAMELARQQHPSESVLFNIDSVAPNQGRTEAGALLAAFIKSFNAHCGYFDGDQQHIAKFEYDLDHAGRFEHFKELIAESTDKTWEELRKSAALYSRQIDAAFDEVCGNDPGTTKNIISAYRDDYKPSVSTFAKWVKDYIDAHEPGFRLNFFVDEVGQFIAQNKDLMVNLQTIAEDLNQYCEGASWILVTSQENVEDIVGEMSANSANDFSKIQARFKIRIQLTSKDAKTVIKQRLLAKSTDALPILSHMYRTYKDDFRVLFDFIGGKRAYKCYVDEDDFLDTYPFVPYQFDLFINAMRTLSDNNGFTGRHHSTGARSMLGVFQDVATRLTNGLDGLPPATTEDEALATFDLMFEGLRNELKSEVYGQITFAEEQISDNPIAIRILKALLLVKYCEDFSATPSNLRVLLYGSFKENTSELEQKIKDALAVLERQVYVRRSNNTYSYLTDEEKDVERAIKNTEVRSKDLELTFADLLKDYIGPLKATYTNGAFEHNYSFNLTIDGNPQGSTRNDLTVNIITTPEQDGMYNDIPALPKTLSVALVGSNSFMNELRIYKQTERYANLTGGSGEVRETILAQKRKDNQALYARLREDLTTLLSNARYNAGGTEITEEIGGSGKDRIVAAMQELVKRSYTGLQQVKVRITENDVFNNCLMGQSAIDGQLPEYVQTVFSRIRSLSNTNLVTIGGEGKNSLIAAFSRAEYGWPDIVVRNAVALLYGAGKIEVRRGASSLLEKSALANELKNNHDMDKLVVSVMTVTTPDEIAQIVSGYKNIVGTKPTENDAKAIAHDLLTHLDQEMRLYESSAGKAAQFPFVQHYRECLSRVNSACTNLKSDWQWILREFPQRSGELAQDLKDLQEMNTFVNGSSMAQKWFSVKAFMDGARNEATILGMTNELPEGLLEDAETVLNDPECYRSSAIAGLGAKVKRAEDVIRGKKEELRAAERELLSQFKRGFESYESFAKMDEAKRSRFEQLFENALLELEGADLAFTLKDYTSTFKDKYGAMIVALIIPGDGLDTSPGEESDIPKESESLAKVCARVDHPAIIETENDVDIYLENLRMELLAIVNSGNVVI